ncbi:MAG: Gfo/Idh/MocA family protein [Blastocatellia bacterium]
MPETLANDYGLSRPAEARRAPAPDLPYRPPSPRGPCPGIGVIGCGGIAIQHLNAYRHAGFRVEALCDRTERKALDYQARFYPRARVATDYRELLALPGVEVVDIATHVEDRMELIEAAIGAGKHVLSQKPFVVDLDDGERLAALAEARGVHLAVNQNGRWAPHFSYLREAVKAGLIGDIQSLTFTLHWDHRWVIGTPFDRMDHLILFDFAIHWFDLTACLLGDRQPRSVYAATRRAVGQSAASPMLAQAAIEFDGGQAAMIFNADAVHGQEDRTMIAGTKGMLVSSGPSLSEQTVTLHTEDGDAQPALEGTWFREGFHGAMGELLCAIEEARPPLNNARGNLRGLALGFAAIASANEQRPVRPGEIRRLPGA